MDTNIQEPTSEDVSDIEYWSESNGSGPASCCLSECECDDSDWYCEKRIHDYKRGYEFSACRSAQFLQIIKPYTYSSFKFRKEIYEKNNMVYSNPLLTKLPSRALLKFMEKGRFDYLTFVRSSGGCCEWCQNEDFIYHMEMCKKENYSFDVCRRCMVELQPILENYDANIQEFKDVLKRNKSLWQNKNYHLHNSALDSLLDDIEDEDEVINDNELASEDNNNEYRELSKADIVLYSKPIEIGTQFTKDSPELPKSEITNTLIYNMIMNCPKLVLRRNTCVSCDICKENTKLYIVIYTTEKEKKRKIETEWDICVKCIYRFDYLIASYLIETWDKVKE